MKNKFFKKSWVFVDDIDSGVKTDNPLLKAKDLRAVDDNFCFLPAGLSG